MRSIRGQWLKVGLLTVMTMALTGATTVGLAPASLAAPARATSSADPATTPVAAPGISAPANVVVGAADGSVQLNVTLNAPGVNPVTVNYGTANGTTSSNTYCNGTDNGYVGQSGTLTFAPGTTSQPVTVSLLNCDASLGSGFEVFYLNLSSNSSDSSIVRASTQIDITGDAPATSTPGLYVQGAEVDNSAGTIDVPVLLGGPSGAATSVAVTVPYSTHNGSAVAGTDYTSTSGTLTFPPGETAQNITVPILQRSGSAPARSFTVTLGTPTNATVAQGTGVVTIGASGAKATATPKISASLNTVVSRVAGYVDLPVTLKAPGVNPVTVNYGTANGTTSSNTYCNGTDNGYVGQGGTLTFEPGVTTQVVRVPLLNCGQAAKATFYLELSDNSSDSTIARAKTTITVVPKVTKPGAPRTVTAVAGNGTATVDFAAPSSDGGSAVYSYTVTASPGGATASGFSSPITVSGLTNGTAYTFTVTATNTQGTGSASLPSNSVTPS
jgi:large repetitive protein